MVLPIISQLTIDSFIADLQSNDESLNASELLKQLSKQNPVLAKTIAKLANGSTVNAANMLYICEILSKQIESNQLDDLLE